MQNNNQQNNPHEVFATVMCILFFGFIFLCMMYAVASYIPSGGYTNAAGGFLLF